jgi:hypothetical protein
MKRLCHFARSMAGVVIIISGASALLAAEPSIDDADWRFSLDVSYLYGHVSGYVQTPSGGEPGTTSSKRPRFSELGIDNASMADVAATGAWHNEELYLGAQIIRLSGDATLDEPLVSHGTNFPAGTSVSSDIQLDWYRFGYRHRFELLDDRSLTISPGVGAAVLDFSYRLDASGAGPLTSRSYVKIGPQLALDLNGGRTTDRFRSNWIYWACRSSHRRSPEFSPKS